MNNYFSSLLQKLFQAPADTQVIINNDDLKRFYKKACSSSARQRPQVSSKERLSGEKASSSNGRGMDYSESRTYISGDDTRLINWKQSAKSGELITNKYYQENENIDYILLDLRAGMLFGTRTQPKAALAIKLAIVSTLASIKQGQSVCVIALENKLKPSQVMSSFDQAMRYFNLVSAKNRSNQRPDQPALSSSLKYLQALKAEHASVSVISDCNDLTENDTAMIKNLSSVNRMRVFRIQDQIEITLPDIYPLNYQSTSGKQSVSITSKTQLKHYQNTISSANKKIRDLINSLDLPVTYLSNQVTDEEIFTQQMIL